MRPIRRGDSPQAVDYANYQDAKTDLISRFGAGIIGAKHVASYCSFCERKIETMLAVEHIEPKKGPYGQPHLIGRWNNFLLACVNCNSTKKDKQVILADVLLPDRDNTFYAFEYLPDGNIKPSTVLTAPLKKLANETLKLVGLDKEMRQSLDEHGNLIAQDRSSQRMQAWDQAEIAKQDVIDNPGNMTVMSMAVRLAVQTGFFSVWMTVFDNNNVMKNLLLQAFSGTVESGCYDLLTMQSVTPAPNPDLLTNGGKI